LSSHWSRSDAQCDMWPFLRKQKKRKKDTPRQWQTGYSPRPPTSPYRSQSLHAEWSLVCSSIFQVLLKAVQWFRRCGWSKIVLPYYFGQWLIQQLVLPYKPWFYNFATLAGKCLITPPFCHAAFLGVLNPLILWVVTQTPKRHTRGWQRVI